MKVRKLHIEIDLETEEYQDLDLMKKAIRLAMESIFFLDIKLPKIIVSEVKDGNVKSA